MKKILLIAASTLLFASNGLSDFSMKISNSTLQIDANVRLKLDTNFFARATYLINTNKKNFYSIGGKVEGEAIGSDLPITLHMGIDFVKTEDNSAIPLSIGASSYLDITQFPIFARAEFSYAPKILSFQKADKFLKGQLEIGSTFIENAEMFLGYRNINFKKNYNSTMYVGASILF